MGAARDSNALTPPQQRFLIPLVEGALALFEECEGP